MYCMHICQIISFLLIIRIYGSYKQKNIFNNFPPESISINLINQTLSIRI